MIESRHDHEHMAALLDLMLAMSDVTDPWVIAAQAIERLLARGMIAGGGIWLAQAGDLVCLTCQNLEPDDLLPVVQRAIAASVPEQLTSVYQHTSRATILPLRGAGDRIGALAAVTRAPPGPADLLLLQAVAAHLGVALAHARPRQSERGDSSDRVWEEFLAHTAHEVKNPLASIKGYADLLLRRAAKDPADPYRKGLTTISQQVGRTTALLEQLSDITRIGSGRMRIDRHAGDFTAVVDRVVQEHQAAGHPHTISLDGSDMALPGRFDAVRMGQVVGAMIGNAIKFSPDGGAINVLLRRSDADDGAPVALLSVGDTGVGVPVGEQERVFERFFRGSNIRGTYSGLGVGLYIARAILDLHGGRIWLERQRGQGTICRVALPLT